ncbi:MAG: choice-of-anchor tandem repeat GloVer-containing protein [Bacteroidota bacterium]
MNWTKLKGMESVIYIRRACLFSVLGVLITLVPDIALAQYAKLHDFGDINNGSNPYSSPISDGTYLYGTTYSGGINDDGIIYKVKADGSGFAKLLDFDGDNGSQPLGSLMYDGTYLYGTTLTGGDSNHGVLFKIKPDGTGFTKLFDFDFYTAGSNPQGALISDGTFLYGTASQGGASFAGTVFKIKTDGTAFTKLMDFDGTNAGTGGYPYSTLYSDGTFLYGTTSGENIIFGNVFKIKPDGTGYVKLVDFSITNGFYPFGGVVSDGTYLYGTTNRGGDYTYGTIYKVKTDGSSFSKLVDFDYSATKGAFPQGALTYDGSFLYGTTSQSAGFFGIVFRLNTGGGAFTKLFDLDVGTASPSPQGTLFFDGSSTLYGANSGVGAGAGYIGAVYKINTNGTGHTRLVNFERAGNAPSGALFSDGTFQYGMTSQGGLNNAGTIFKIKPDGTGFVRLLDFDTNTGKIPYGSLISDGTFLYGMTNNGGTNDQGTIFKIKPDGTGFVKLLDFNSPVNGNNPKGPLLYDGTFLYGMTPFGGTNSYGTIFKIKPDGSGFVKLFDFDGVDGGYPYGDLITDGTFLYGMANSGGDNGGWGTVFKINKAGSGFQRLVEFDYSNTGSQPNGSLISDGTFLYGMTTGGGANLGGTIFKVKTDGTGYVKMLDFDDPVTGSQPYGSFISDGTYFYATTSQGGAASKGTVFRIKPDGTGFAKLLNLTDGYSNGTLITDGTLLYGMTSDGGNYNKGTIFSATTTAFVSVATMDPQLGSVGTFVTIEGTNFDPVAASNIVKFNNVTAVVKSASTTTIVAVVPDGATTGPVSVTTTTTGTSVTDFGVTTESNMFDGKVQNCNVGFTGVNGSDDIRQTFLPVNPADKVKVSFSHFVVDDILLVYDGPTISSPLVATLSGHGNPPDIIATGPGGELTFQFSWQDANTDFDALITCVSTSTIAITTQPEDIAVCAGATATFSTLASGVPNITYQWQFSSDGTNYNDVANGGGYSNATTSTLSINTTGIVSGRYRCHIKGDVGQETYTSDKLLTVNAVPLAPTKLTSVTVCGPATVDLKVSGGTNGQYLWYAVATGGSPINGQNNSVYTTPLLTTATTYYASVISGTCESPRTAVPAPVQVCNPPAIATTFSTGFIEGIVTIDLTSLITDKDNNVDVSTLKITSQPSSGATATLAGLSLRINYAGIPFVGTDNVSIGVCDLTNLCTTQQITIAFEGDIKIFNALSPNGDGKNDFFFLQYIDILPTKQANTVKIYNRWGDEVFSVNNYNNNDRAFTGLNSSGNKLANGTYYYKITFASGDKELTGFLELR